MSVPIPMDERCYRIVANEIQQANAEGRPVTRLGLIVKLRERSNFPYLYLKEAVDKYCTQNSLSLVEGTVEVEHLNIKKMVASQP